MGRNDDKVFMKRFSGVIGGLAVITVLFLVIAGNYDKQPDPADNPSRVELAEERIQPVGAVRTEMPTAEEMEADPEPEAPVVAALEAPIDGEAIYTSACRVCHLVGAANAPIPGSDAWATRVAKGAEVLYASAINGINAMPAKGGRGDLSDAEIEAAVDFMLAQ